MFSGPFDGDDDFKYGTKDRRNEGSSNNLARSESIGMKSVGAGHIDKRSSEAGEGTRSMQSIL
jgi:hypothetical protein